MVLLFIPTFLTLFYSLYQVFVVVPNEQIMGPVQRIFYFHVAAATTCYLCFGAILFASIFYLVSKKKIWSDIITCASEVGFLFCTIVLITGMIWGHAAWNTIFRWEPRLVSFLLLWFIYLSFFIVRGATEKDKIGTVSSIVGIVGSITVPLTIFSIKLLPASQQLHPQVIEKGGLNPAFVPPLIWASIAFVLLGALLNFIRFRISQIENHYE